MQYLSNEYRTIYEHYNNCMSASYQDESNDLNHLNDFNSNNPLSHHAISNDGSEIWEDEISYVNDTSSNASPQRYFPLTYYSDETSCSQYNEHPDSEYQRSIIRVKNPRVPDSMLTESIGNFQDIDDKIKIEKIMEPSSNGAPTSIIKVVKKRCTANKKERKRTKSINNAYADLRDCIPSVPADTKLSKIKTLRLATSYISFLQDILDGNVSGTEFFAELGNLSNSNYRKSNNANNFKMNLKNPPLQHSNGYNIGENMNNISEKMEKYSSKTKPRTGWPEHVWAHECKQVF